MNKSTILKSAYRVLGRATLAAGLLAGVTAIPASGAEFIPIENEELLIARPGTITTVGEVQVDPANVGALCRLTVVTENGASIHYGNNLIVTTGDQQAVIEDVEATADQTTDLSVELTVGETISFGLEMGPDWVSSLGFGLEIDCTLPQPVVSPATPNQCTEIPTTTVAGAVPTTAVPTTAATPTTAAPEPCVSATTPTTAAPLETAVTVPAPVTPPCSEEASANLSVVPGECPEPVTTTTAPPVQQPAPEAPATAEPEVLGVQVERLSPATPAVPVAANPTYNG